MSYWPSIVDPILDPFTLNYTAGSMAGLGFSMAVLGLSLGILVGFLLWKRRLGLPYYVG